MLGDAAVAMWWDIAPEMKAEFEDWHTHEHMPERLGIPGFLRGTRWIALSGEPSYFVLYQADSVATITSGAYVERLNNPTPWSRKMMPQHRNMVRSLCSVQASFGAGLAHALATVRFSPARGREAALSKWLAAHALPTLPQRKGLTSASLLESVPTAGTPQTAEQKIRGKDATADSVLLIGGYEVEAVKALVEDVLSPDALAAHGALLGPAAGLYRVAYSLSARERP
jgi:hypothetical protein